MPEIELANLALLVFAGFLAGWVDAVVGGGGLIQLPALLLFSPLAPVQAVATNKVAAIMGTSVAAVTYIRRIGPDWRTALPIAGMAFAGSVGGAALAAALPAVALKPIIVAACAIVALWVGFRRSTGIASSSTEPSRRRLVLAMLLGAAIGAYDGLIGPGTGTFVVISLVAILGNSFLRASANAKIINVATNLGALAFFIPAGAVVWAIGLAVGTGNLIGGYVGARTAIARGSTFVRVVLLTVVGALLVTLVWDIITEA